MNTCLRVLCADDEPLARETLRALVEAEAGLELVALCSDGDEALRRARELEPDLLVLDVQMPGRSGIEVVEGLAESARPLVVFATAHDDHAVAAFDLHAVDYLLKPFDDARFRMALTRARERLAREGPGPGRERLDRLVRSRGSELLALPREGRVEYVPHAEILWVEAADQYVEVHLVGGRKELLRASMAQLERVLGDEAFLRVHRSALVALARVRRIETFPSGTGELVLEDGTVVPIARTRLAVVKRSLAAR
ncbi:MAG: LytTR family DNA-binding domain-containing protein [Planctomycetota bacterium]